MTDAEREELDRLRREDDLRSLGDRPSSPPVKELRRRFELERKAAASTDAICQACEREGMCAKCETAWLESK